MNDHIFICASEILNVGKVEKSGIHDILPAAFNGRFKNKLWKSIALMKTKFPDDDSFLSFMVTCNENLANDRTLIAQTIQQGFLSRNDGAGE